jgi:hypothetical protein
MGQRRDDVEYHTKHDVALSATISTPVFAAIHHRIVGAMSMFATESVHSQMVVVATAGSDTEGGSMYGDVAQRVLGTVAQNSIHVPSTVTA